MKNFVPLKKYWIIVESRIHAETNAEKREFKDLKVKKLLLQDIDRPLFSYKYTSKNI